MRVDQLARREALLLINSGSDRAMKIEKLRSLFDLHFPIAQVGTEQTDLFVQFIREIRFTVRFIKRMVRDYRISPGSAIDLLYGIDEHKYRLSGDRKVQLRWQETSNGSFRGLTIDESERRPCCPTIGSGAELQGHCATIAHMANLLYADKWILNDAIGIALRLRHEIFG